MGLNKTALQWVALSWDSVNEEMECLAIVKQCCIKLG